jgi:hypothetical protein
VRDCGGVGLADALLSPSDKAKSCFMISAFSALFAFVGPVANSFIDVAHITSAVAPPINAMLIVIRVGSAAQAVA